MADGDGLRLNGEARDEAVAALGEDVVQQHRVHAPDDQVAVRMDVILVRHGLDAVFASRPQKDVVRDGIPQRRHPVAPQIGQRPEAGGVGVADAQDFTKFVVRNRGRRGRAARRRVFDAAQPDIGVATADRLVQRHEGDHHEPRRPPESPCDEPGQLDIEPDELIRMTRIRLDERCAALGIAGPKEFARCVCRCGKGQRRCGYARPHRRDYNHRGIEAS